MALFDVYPQYDIVLTRGSDIWIWDAADRRYLDCYGGHAVISIGHAHPHFQERVAEQLERLPFYSNAFRSGLQEEYAARLGQAAGYGAHNLFLCNSGAEANENALKAASFHTGRKAVLAFTGAFHGRTSGAIAVTDNPAIRAPFNAGHEVVFAPFNDEQALHDAFAQNAFAAAIIEGIQGVAGIRVADSGFLRTLRRLCSEHGTLLILDEVQAGFGRTGSFFAHQSSGIEADIVSMAKGMGNGFPVAGILVTPRVEARSGMLGTTFGGGHLACAAALAVLEVLEDEELAANARDTGALLREALAGVEGVTEVRGRGLMIGLDTAVPAPELRARLLREYGLLTGGGGGPHTVRLLPPLTLPAAAVDAIAGVFSDALKDFQQQGPTT